MIEINKNTRITKGLRLNENFIIDHVSSGAYHHVMGKIIPTFTPFLRPGQKNLMPDWSSARNLQIGADNILDDLLYNFGNSLILRSGFNPGNLGQIFDVQIDGYQNNMYGVAKDIEKLASKAKNLQFIYGDSSFARISFDKESVKNNIIEKITTLDTINNITETGITSIRGLF